MITLLWSEACSAVPVLAVNTLLETGGADLCMKRADVMEVRFKYPLREKPACMCDNST